MPFVRTVKFLSVPFTDKMGIVYNYLMANVPGVLKITP